ncbi:unnamed protein product, partial [Didymodactylos carnosus]
EVSRFTQNVMDNILGYSICLCEVTYQTKEFKKSAPGPDTEVLSYCMLTPAQL